MWGYKTSMGGVDPISREGDRVRAGRYWGVRVFIDMWETRTRQDSVIVEEKTER